MLDLAAAAPADYAASMPISLATQQRRQARVLVFGYGNPGRQDDGLGPAAAAGIEALGWPDVTAMDNYQLSIEDAVDIAAHDVVWFVDAARVGAAPFSVTRLTPAATYEFTSHLIRPEAILALADRCYGRTPKAFLLAIRGYEFAFIEAITPQAEQNLKSALGALSILIRTAQMEVVS